MEKGNNEKSYSPIEYRVDKEAKKHVATENNNTSSYRNLFIGFISLLLIVVTLLVVYISLKTSDSKYQEVQTLMLLQEVRIDSILEIHSRLDTEIRLIESRSTNLKLDLEGLDSLNKLLEEVLYRYKNESEQYLFDRQD